MRIAGIALNPYSAVGQSRSELVQNLRDFVMKVEADIVVLPEAAFTGFFPKDETVFESDLTEYVYEEMLQLASQSKKYLVFGLFREIEGNRFNLAYVIDPNGSVLAEYKKNKVFQHSGEDKFIRPGESSSLFSLGQLRSSIKICYDLRFPNLFYRDPHWVDLFIVIAQWPSEREAQLVSLVKARAIENEGTVICVNASGRDTFDTFYPGTLVAFSPNGQPIEGAKVDSEFDCCIWNISNRDSYEILKSKEREHQT